MKYIKTLDLYWFEYEDDNVPYVDEDIVRLATTEEIKQYELEQVAKKYNL